MYLSFQFQMNQKERVISEFEMDFKKSCLSSSLNSTYTRSENGYGFKRRVWNGSGKFLVWKMVGILRTGRLTPTKNSREYPLQPPEVTTTKKNTLSYIKKTRSNFAVATIYRPMEQPWEQR